MGLSSSKQPPTDGLSLEKLKSLQASSIHRVEAEYVYRSMHRRWYGYGQRDMDVYDTPFPASPLYDSGDDEPTEPSSVINALAVTVPPLGSRQHRAFQSGCSSIRRTRPANVCPTADQTGILQVGAVPHSHEALVRTASAAAAAIAAAAASAIAAAAASASTASSSSSGVLRRSSSGSSNSSSGSSRHSRSSRSSRSTAEEVTQHDRASNVDADLRPLHHLHLMQQRRHTQHHAAHHQHHKQRQQQQQVAACAHLQVHRSGWYVTPMGKLAEVAAS